MPARTLRATSGKLITIIAMTTAFHVKMISMPAASSARPTGLRRPKNHSSNRPDATGGSTSGSETIVSSSVLPGNCLRASSQPIAIAGGSTSAVASKAISTVNRAMAHVSALIEGSWPAEAAAIEHRARGRALQELQEAPALLLRTGRRSPRPDSVMSRYGCSFVEMCAITRTD